MYLPLVTTCSVDWRVVIFTQRQRAEDFIHTLSQLSHSFMHNEWGLFMRTFTDPYFEPPETLDVVIQLCHFSVGRPRAYTTTMVDLVIRIKQEQPKNTAMALSYKQQHQ